MLWENGNLDAIPLDKRFKNVLNGVGLKTLSHTIIIKEKDDVCGGGMFGIVLRLGLTHKCRLFHQFNASTNYNNHSKACYLMHVIYHKGIKPSEMIHQAIDRDMWIQLCRT